MKAKVEAKLRCAMPWCQIPERRRRSLVGHLQKEREQKERKHNKREQKEREQKEREQKERKHNKRKTPTSGLWRPTKILNQSALDVIANEPVELTEISAIYHKVYADSATPVLSAAPPTNTLSLLTSSVKSVIFRVGTKGRLCITSTCVAVEVIKLPQAMYKHPFGCYKIDSVRLRRR